VKIVKARLKARATTDGLVEFNDNVPLGKEYTVDADTIAEMSMLNTEKNIEHTKVIVREYPGGSWLPMELLSFGDDQ
jgi:hypothetical protein